MMIQNAIRLGITLLVLPSAVAHAQARPIPVRTVAAPVMSVEHFGIAPNVRHLPDGRVLVNDMRGKRLLVFDSTLASFTVSADSNSSNGVLYPYTGLRTPLIPYLGDSTLFIDFQAKTYLVIDPAGRIGRAMAHPKSSDLSAVSVPYAGTPAIDNQGRLIYRALSGGRPRPRAGDPPDPATRDTFAIVRADFNLRTVDTIASFSVPRIPSPVFTDGPKGKPVGTLRINPLPGAPDEWAVLSDGTLAIVREHDYHIDWVTPDGMKSSSPKLPFDWRRLTDEDKLARIDSMKKVIDSVAATGRPYAMTVRFMGATADGPARTDTIIPTISYVPVAEISDYVAPLRQGSVRADVDGNLWILPVTSAQAGNGLVYDVVNRKGELVERVRLPADCVLVGHGKGGVVYVARNQKSDNTWVLGRTRVVR